MSAAEGAAARAWQDWLPEVVLGAVVAVLGLVEALNPGDGGAVTGRVGVALGVAAAVVLCRRQPGGALALVWLVGILQVLGEIPVLSIEVAVAVVAFGCARWGRPATVVVSGLSIPAAAGVGVLLVLRGSYGFFRDIGPLREVIDNAYRFSDTLLVGASVLAMLVLALPWLAGLVLRMTSRLQRSRLSQAAAEEDAATAQRVAGQAQEIARLRDEQARLARDVHDVVGHSLAVILAQAESAQYLPDEPETLKRTLATIATSARSSLQDVRGVLAATRSGGAAVPPQDDVDALVDGIRATGQEVHVTEVGSPQPLPPELAVVAHRVLQEMLTNAVKHGERGHPIDVERHWPAGGFGDDLRLEVRNTEKQETVASEETVPLRLAVDADAGSQGQGLPGMRRRLESVGGRLDVRRRQHGDLSTFTATAWVPVRTAAR